MIDVIVPIYNSRKTLFYTLTSIKLQTIINKVNVILVDDCSDEKYDDIISEFSDLKIKYIKLEKNVGAGLARQKGIENSNGEYIVFIDSDDLFYNSYSLYELYKKISYGYDLVCGLTYELKRNFLICNNGSLHGKIYRRSFIKNNNIEFNDTRYHEDNFFHNMVLLCNPKQRKIEDIVYIYNYNKESLTNIDDKEFERLEILIKNTRKLIDEAIKRNIYYDKDTFFLRDKINYFNKIFPSFTSYQKKTLIYWIKKYNLGIEDYISK